MPRPRRRAARAGSRSWSTLWWAEAEEHGVLPARRPHHRAVRRPLPRPLAAPARTATTPTARRCRRCRRRSAPRSAGASWDMTATIDRPAGADGVLYATGTENSGLSLFVQDDRLVFDYNCFGDAPRRRVRPRRCPTGASVVGVRFRRDGRGRRRPRWSSTASRAARLDAPVRDAHDLERRAERRLRPRLPGERPLPRRRSRSRARCTRSTSSSTAASTS